MRHHYLPLEGTGCGADTSVFSLGSAPQFDEVAIAGKRLIAATDEIVIRAALTLLHLADEIPADMHQQSERLLGQSALHPTLAQPGAEEMHRRQRRL
ncbi:hypothetical protein Pme01_32980 [Planosporangium mesophilum]|uniref:Uncharacterized protein n=1 Tax=Planosporangium mesophilum TaxID=689768 RepID=A0A8J3TDV5_9ACTN|nr:hypothetical protein Pme01_32980 [Planosporangium mesophilum]